MTEILLGLGLVFFIEGSLYALFPSQMQNLMQYMMQLAPKDLRIAGMVSAAFGCLLVWMIA